MNRVPAQASSDAVRVFCRDNWLLFAVGHCAASTILEPSWAFLPAVDLTPARYERLAVSMSLYRVYFYDTHQHIVKTEAAPFEKEGAAHIWAGTLFQQSPLYPALELWTGIRMVERRERTA
jgi:hypothetical protein